MTLRPNPGNRTMGYNPKLYRPVGECYAVPTMLLDRIVRGPSRWALPLAVVLYHFLRLNGFAARPLPDGAFAEIAGCSVQTVARVRPYLNAVFQWDRSPGGAHVYSLRDLPGMPDRGFTFISSRAFHQACRADRTGAYASGLIGLSSWMDATGRIHPSADEDGVASRAHLTPKGLRRIISRLISLGILTDSAFSSVCAADVSGAGPSAMRSRYPHMVLPRDHPRLPPPPDWRTIAESSTARSDPRRCGRKGGIIRWHGYAHPSYDRVSSSEDGAPYIYTEGLKTKASASPPTVLKPFLETERSIFGRAPPDVRRLPVTGGERRMLDTQQGIRDAARWGLTDRKRLELFRRAQTFRLGCDCPLDDHTRREIAERALIFGEETLIRHQAALTRPGCRRPPISNRGGWAWAIIRTELRIIVRSYHHCPPEDEPSAPLTPAEQAAHEKRMKHLEHANPELFQILTRMSERHAQTAETITT